VFEALPEDGTSLSAAVPVGTGILIVTFEPL
jgi:hypothetical protein